MYQPFKKPLPERHAQLAREHNPLLEWSFDRLVNLDLAHGVRAPPLAKFLEAVPATAQSAVLTEKLASLYAAQGKPSSAINAFQTALKLNPSPQQRLRIRRHLAEELLAQNRAADAAEIIALLDRAYVARSEIHARLAAKMPAVRQSVANLFAADRARRPAAVSESKPAPHQIGTRADEFGTANAAPAQ